MGCCVSDDFEGHRNGSMSKSNRPNDKEIDLSHFRMLGVMGQGGFGVVRVGVKLSGGDAGTKYAVKCLIKRSILDRSSGPSAVLTELRALAILDSPYICNCHYAFQNKACLFLVLDLALGGDMRYNLKYSPKKSISRTNCQVFYLSSTASGRCLS